MAEKRTGRRLTWIVTPQRDGQKVDTVLRRELGLSGTVVRRVKWHPAGRSAGLYQPAGTDRTRALRPGGGCGPAQRPDSGSWPS